MSRLELTAGMARAGDPPPRLPRTCDGSFPSVLSLSPLLFASEERGRGEASARPDFLCGPAAPAARRPADPDGRGLHVRGWGPGRGPAGRPRAWLPARDPSWALAPSSRSPAPTRRGEQARHAWAGRPGARTPRRRGPRGAWRGVTAARVVFKSDPSRLRAGRAPVGPAERPGRLLGL